MLTWTILGLGLFAGLTIFLSLPVARMREIPSVVRIFLGSLTAGILLFLFWDVMDQAIAPLSAAAYANDVGTVGLDAVLVLGAFGLSFLGLTSFELWYRARVATGPAQPDGRPAPLSPLRAMEFIAVGIGFHNFAEGLAIGTAAAVTGGLTTATVLVVGFALHNATEGFGVAGPAVAAGVVPSWRRLAALGLVAGGPTFLGTIVGSVVVLPDVSLAFLGVAAGAIIYVVIELVQGGRGVVSPRVRTMGIFVGFAVGLLTDLVVTAGHV
ncbi:MAG TPA: zinc permease [Thermoplasmata archaeon]|nr:zinc permease [Thermoplasmata archaeon]